MRKILFMVLTAVFLMAGCGDLADLNLNGGSNSGNTGSGNTSDLTVESIVVEKTNIELDLNPLNGTSSFQISAVVKPENLEESKKGLLYRSDNTNIVEVDDKGIVTANSKGTTFISVESTENPKVTARVDVTVIDTTSLDTPSAIILNLSSIELDVNPVKNKETFQIEATVLPNGLDENKKLLTYDSDNKNVADVSVDGLVTAVKSGTANVTVTSKIDNKVTAKLIVTVKDTINEIVEVNNIQVDEKIIQLDLTNKPTGKINAVAFPQEANNKKLLYSIEPVNIASINNIGEITALNTGNGNIIITSESNPEIKKEIPLEIINSAAENGQEVPITGLAFEEKEIILKVGETYQLTPKFTPPNTTQRNLYFDKDPLNGVGTIELSDSGLITALKPGKSWPRIGSNDKNGLSVEIKVQVVDENGPIELNSLSVAPKTITVNKDSYLGYFGNNISINYEPSNTTQKSVQFISESPLVTINESGIARVANQTGTATVKVQSTAKPELFDTVTLNIIDPFDKEPPVYKDINPSEMNSYPDRMYIKIMFDLESSIGDLYNETERVGIRGIDFQSKTESGTLIVEPQPGYISPYGFCEKYKCFADRDGLENTLIAKKNVGITYYVGNNKLYTPVKTSGITNFELYMVFFKTAGMAYSRPTINLPIDWSKYDKNIHKNAVKFHVKVKDKITTVDFVGFEEK